MASPPAKSKRRWVQFSLRTGFIVVTALCFTLGLWVVPAERQRRAVKAIEAMGGRVEYWIHDDVGETFLVRFLRRWLPPDYFDEVFHVDFGRSQVTDTGLAHLQRLTGVRRLWLGHTQITDAGLARLQGFTDLRELELSSTQITDAGLTHLRGLTDLRVLTLKHSKVTGVGVANLQGLNRLEELDFRFAQVTDLGLTSMQGLTSTRYLCLVGTQVTEQGLNQLRNALPECRIEGP